MREAQRGQGHHEGVPRCDPGHFDLGPWRGAGTYRAERAAGQARHDRV